MKQGFEALEFNLDKDKLNTAKQILKKPRILASKQNNILNQTVPIRIPLQGVSYKLIGDIEEILQYLNINKQASFFSDHDFLEKKMNISISIRQGVQELTMQSHQIHKNDDIVAVTTKPMDSDFLEIINPSALQEMIPNEMIIKKSELLGSSIQNFVNIIINLIPKQYNMSTEGLYFDTRKEEIFFGELEQEIRIKLKKHTDFINN